MNSQNLMVTTLAFMPAVVAHNQGEWFAKEELKAKEMQPRECIFVTCFQFLQVVV